jgi:hypothetical protein
MSFKKLGRLKPAPTYQKDPSYVRAAVTLAALAFIFSVSPRGAGPRFLPDDPIDVDRDTQFDASGAKPINLSEAFDVVENNFGNPGSHEAIRAMNVNTLDEVPDSSWFTNRIGRRPMTVAEIVKGPDTFEKFDITDWIVTGGKGPAGFQPGFRAIDARDRSQRPQLFQLELDTEPFPELATGAEMIGTLIYHAIGYNVVDTYIVNVDPKKVRIQEGTTVRDASGRRRLVQGDIDEIFRLGKPNPDGTYRMTASRFVEGEPMGNFKHYGTRPDDPNDIYPHEHRREIRANRVFASWINHDDSRALNTLDMLVTANGRKHIKHYMFDFGAILGSSPDRPRSGFEYMLEKKPTLAALLSFGLYTPSWRFIDYRKDIWKNIGRIEAEHFNPETWRPEYPNQAFKNMQPDDAFWAARIVAAFSDEAVAAVVKRAAYTDPKVTDYLTNVLKERRDRIAKAWLNKVNPLVDFRLGSDGTLTFDNAAVRAKASTPGRGYTLGWSRFDNAADTHQLVGGEQTVTEPVGKAPAGLGDTGYVSVMVRSQHPDHPAWSQPVRAYFRREGSGWKTVGLERLAK